MRRPPPTPRRSRSTTTRSAAATATSSPTPAPTASAAPMPNRSRQMRDNYGFDCNGVRMPATARTTYSATGKLNYTYGTGSRVSLQPGAEPVPGPHLPLHHRLHQQSLHRHGAGLQQPEPAGDAELDPEPVQERRAGAGARRGAVLPAGPHHQRAHSPPRATSSTRDPFGGFIVGGLDFEYDFDNFPVNQELIDNVRRNEGRHHADRREQRQPSTS